MLLVPVVCPVIRLVLVYRVDSIDPVLSDYYLELLALVFLTLGFYRLSSFAFGAGRTDRFALYAGLAVVLCRPYWRTGSAPASCPSRCFTPAEQSPCWAFCCCVWERLFPPESAGAAAALPDADDCTAPPSDNS